MNHFLDADNQYIEGSDNNLFEVIGKVDGYIMDSDMLPFKYSPYGMPEDRILFIGTKAQFASGTYVPAHVKEDTPLNDMGYGVAKLKNKISVSDDDFIAVLKEVKKKPTASYSHFLREAAQIADDREPDYGSAFLNMQDTADIAKAMFGLTLTAAQVAQVLIAVKTSRQKHRHKLDNIIDSINYHAIMLLAKEQESQSSSPTLNVHDHAIGGQEEQ